MLEKNLIASLPPPALMRNLIRPSREISQERNPQLLWLDKNENCDPDYLAFIHDALQPIPNKALTTYPDCYPLYKKLAAHLQIEIPELFIAAGSDGVIRTVYETFVAAGDVVLYTEPTFAMYAVYAQMFGAKSHVVHYTASDHGPQLSADQLITAIHEHRPKLVGLPNPNSPTGTLFSQLELQAIIKQAEVVNAVILIDEAYYPFHNETMLPYIHDYANLIIVRSFSKAWGCAGLRMGVGIANRDLICECQKMRPMYEVGTLNIMLTERLLEFAPEMLASVARLNHGKDYFLRAMHQLGFKTVQAYGNFLHVDFDQHAAAIHAALANKVLYRTFTHPALAQFSRFTATTEPLFTPLVATIKDIVCDPSSLP